MQVTSNVVSFVQYWNIGGITFINVHLQCTHTLVGLCSNATSQVATASTAAELLSVLNQALSMSSCLPSSLNISLLGNITVGKSSSLCLLPACLPEPFSNVQISVCGPARASK